jgi:hypothetical protein
VTQKLRFYFLAVDSGSVRSYGVYGVFGVQVPPLSVG